MRKKAAKERLNRIKVIIERHPDTYIADRTVLQLLRGSLKAPVQVEDEKTGKIRIEGGKSTNRK